MIGGPAAIIVVSHPSPCVDFVVCVPVCVPVCVCRPPWVCAGGGAGASGQPHYFEVMMGLKSPAGVCVCLCDIPQSVDSWFLRSVVLPLALLVDALPPSLLPPPPHVHPGLV